MALQMNELVPVPGPVAVSAVEGSVLNGGGARGHLALSLWALRHIIAFPLDGTSMQDITLPLACILELFRPAETITASSGSEDAEGPASTDWSWCYTWQKKKVMQNKRPSPHIILALAGNHQVESEQRDKGETNCLENSRLDTVKAPSE